jgi:SAM-dependent methyltransferase
MVRRIAAKSYRLIHKALHATLPFNPLFPKTRNGKPVKYGFISNEHLADPSLDDRLVEGLRDEGVEVGPYRIDVKAFHDYLDKANYAKSYHGGRNAPGHIFLEKTLEHFVSIDVLSIGPDDVVMDLAADRSSFYEIVRRLWAPKMVYRQDLKYKPGVNEDTVGGEAGHMALEDDSISKATLHCSLEHFEGNSDLEMITEMSRVLKPGGTLCVLPFYIAREYTIHTDPVANLFFARNVKFDPEAQIRYCNWTNRHSRHYDLEHLKKRIFPNLGKLRLKVLRVENFREVHPDCYLRFIGLFQKQK